MYKLKKFINLLLILTLSLSFLSFSPMPTKTTPAKAADSTTINLGKIGALPTIGEVMNVAVSPNSNYAYVASTKGMQILDITNEGPIIKSSIASTSTYTVTADNNSYVYAGVGKALQIINAQDPVNPYVTASLDLGDYVYGLNVVGNKVYIANYTAGLKIVDVSNKTDPVLLNSIDTPGAAMSVSVDGNIAILADGTAGLVSFDISNPNSPRKLGEITTFMAAGVKTKNQIAYVAAGNAGIEVISFDDPANMTLRGSFAADAGSMNGISLSDSGRYAYVSNTAGSSDRNGSEILDLENLSAIHRESFLPISGIIRGPGVAKNNRLYFPAGGFGLVVINIDNPAAPLVVSSITNTKLSNDVKINGNKLYALNGYSTLFIYDITDPTKPVHLSCVNLAGSVLETDSSGYVYVGGGFQGRDISAINISNPSRPVIEATLSLTAAVYDLAYKNNKLYVANYTAGFTTVPVNRTNPISFGSPQIVETPGQAMSVEISGNYAFVADGMGGFLSINLTTHAITSMATPDWTYSVAIKGTYAYLGSGSILVVVNIQNPSNLINSGELTTNENIRGLNISPTLPYIFMATFGSRKSYLQVVNITDPINPVSMSSLPVDETARSIASQGRNIYVNSDKTLVGIYDLYYDYLKVDNSSSCNGVSPCTSVNHNQEITYTLKATNPNPYTLTNLNLSDPIPTGTSYVSSTGEGQLVGTEVKWSNLASIAPNATIEMSFKVKVN